MTSLDFTRRAATLALLASLAACGGGGGGDSSAPAPEPTPTPTPNPTPTPTPNPTPTPATITGQYISQPPAAAGAASLAALNAQGARGFAFLGTLATNTGAASTEQGDFYVSDTAHAGSRLEYETVAQPGSGEALVAQLNAQGARGFAYKAPVLTGGGSNPSSLTVRDTSRSTTFSYEKQPISGALSRDAFQSQLNAQGARGYRLVGPLMAGADSFNLYVKDSSATTYSYTVLDGDGPSGVGTGDALRQRLNTQGAQGQLFLGAFVIQANASAQVFERSSAQNGPVEYDVRAATPQASIAQLTAAMNDRAAQGYFFFSDLVASGGEQLTLSVRNAANLRNPLAGITFP